MTDEATRKRGTFCINLGWIKAKDITANDLMTAALVVISLVMLWKLVGTGAKMTTLTAKVDSIVQEKTDGTPIEELLRDGDSKDGVRRPQ